LKIVHFLGYSNSGKTHAISLLTRELTRAGKRVGTLKHIHDKRFSIDRRGKDTWLLKKAGASAVIAISSHEFVVMRDRAGVEIEKDLKEAFRIFRHDGTDYLFIEGFHSILREKTKVKEIVCASNKSEALKLLKLHKQSICILGNVVRSFRASDRSVHNVSILTLPRDKDRLIQLIS
jgi:molybdopterin-guanine dinucleotide biosynthesis protein MobB